MLKWSPLQRARSAPRQFVKVAFSLFIHNLILFFQLEERKARLRGSPSSGRGCAVPPAGCWKGSRQPAAAQGPRGQKHSAALLPLSFYMFFKS